jgi:Uma2 family endonuclease
MQAQAVVLHNINWKSYECLLENYEDSSAPRLAYDRGTLEIMSPLIPHEETNRALATIVERIAQEWRISFRNLGSTTFKRSDLSRGFEPDTCFYFANRNRIAGRNTIDLDGGDPPPDLVIEVDVTSSSVNKLSILAALGVPEVWQVVEEVVTILTLVDGAYTIRENSLALPNLSQSTLNTLLQRRQTIDILDWLTSIHEWARQSIPPPENYQEGGQ